MFLLGILIFTLEICEKNTFIFIFICDCCRSVNWPFEWAERKPEGFKVGGGDNFIGKNAASLILFSNFIFKTLTCRTSRIHN